jgi:hypothetical protein
MVEAFPVGDELGVTGENRRAGVENPFLNYSNKLFCDLL